VPLLLWQIYALIITENALLNKTVQLQLLPIFTKIPSIQISNRLHLPIGTITNGAWVFGDLAPMPLADMNDGVT
jgi:hypothetical protein